MHNVSRGSWLMTTFHRISCHWPSRVEPVPTRSLRPGPTWTHGGFHTCREQTVCTDKTDNTHEHPVTCSLSHLLSSSEHLQYIHHMVFIFFHLISLISLSVIYASLSMVCMFCPCKYPIKTKSPTTRLYTQKISLYLKCKNKQKKIWKNRQNHNDWFYFLDRWQW